MALICKNFIKCFFQAHVFYKSSTCLRRISAKSLECLNSRGLLKVSGNDASQFLQGLITNDMRHLEDGAPAMYALFLNNKGRVMYDSIIYRTGRENEYLIESDSPVLPDLQKHLKVFRVRKKVDICDVSDTLKIWVLHETEVKTSVSFNILDKSFIQGLFSESVIICKDPRLDLLGVRIVTSSDDNVIDAVKNTEGQILETVGNQSLYKICRYKLGVGEGTEDLLPGKSFPLEANADYLHGISFHKGCYIGQELTARTYHTGVVRKRLMPLIFDIVPKDGLKPDTTILAAGDSSKTVLGKLRSAEQNFGLGLLYVAEALKSVTFHILDGMGQTLRPAWWPQEAPKERLTVKP